MMNREIFLTRKVTGKLREDDFELRSVPLAEIRHDQILLRVILISLDAANRAWLNTATYRPKVTAGSPMPAYVLGQVVASSATGFSVNDLVVADACWADFAVADASSARKVDARGPLSHYLSVLGIAGKTAYHGLLRIGQPREKETVVVSAAAGSVGIFAGQIAGIKGASAIGIAGGPEKCAWLVNEIGYDAALDYKQDDLKGQLDEVCPDGVDVYFDNVAGRVSEVVLSRMNCHGRIVCCGAISQYDTGNMASPRGIPGLLIIRRLKMQGFVVTDYANEDATAEQDLARWVDQGRITVVEEIINGLENTPRALIGLLSGENRGKRMVRVSPDSA